MLTKAAQKITDKMIVQDVIIEEDRELYEYGMVQGVIMVINWLTAILIGAILNMVWQTVAYLIMFTPVRIYAGGFHAKTQLQCYFITSLFQFGIMAGIKYLPFTWLAYLIIVLIAVFCMFFIAPLEAENKPMTAEEHIKYGGIARRNWIIEAIVMAACFLLGWDMMCRVIAASFAMVSLLLIMGKIFHKKKNVQAYD